MSPALIVTLLAAGALAVFLITVVVSVITIATKREHPRNAIEPPLLDVEEEPLPTLEKPKKADGFIPPPPAVPAHLRGASRGPTLAPGQALYFPEEEDVSDPNTWDPDTDPELPLDFTVANPGHNSD